MRKPNATCLVLAALAALALISCSGVRVQTDWDPEVDFSRFETFVLLENDEPAVNALIDGRIRTAIGDHLASNGFREADSIEEADLAIGYQVATEQRHRYETISTGWHSHGFRHRRRTRWHGSMATTTTRRREYTVGALVIAVYETGEKELVWEGSGSRRIGRANDPEQSRQRIVDAVERVLRDFPPKS